MKIALPQPIYPCRVDNVTAQQNTVTMQLSSDTTAPIDVAVYLKDPTTREPLDVATVTMIGQEEQTVAVQAPATPGSQQLIYEVNYYSDELKQEVSCANGANFITVDVTEPVINANTETQTETNVIVTNEAPVDTTVATNWSLIGVTIGGFMVIGVIGWWWTQHKTKPHKGPGDTTKPVPPVIPNPKGPRKKYVCSCTVSITAPSELPLCQCWHSPMSFNFSGHKAFLDVHDLQKKQTHTFQATFTPHCAGQARNITYVWKLSNVPQANQPIPEALELECVASYDATLPNGENVHVSCSSVKKIKLVPQLCQVYIIYVAGEANDIGYGHVAMQIDCGPNNVIYGFYSANNSLSGPGQVLSNADPGKNYENFYPGDQKLVFNITAINGGKKLTCHQCQRLVNFWKFLATDPGQYGTDNTCTTRLADALEAVGLIDPANFKKSFWGPVVGTNQMATSYPNQFINVLFEGIAPDKVIEPITQEK